MKNLAVIPARGGSKRIPRKNIKSFLGKPIIAYSIEVAFKSTLFDEIMVSTDDQEIANIAIQYGAKIPFMRSNKTANDLATLSDVIEEVREMYIQSDITFDNICCILPTAPLITVGMLTQGLQALIEKKADSVRPIVRFGYPIQRSFRQETNGHISFLYPEYRRSRSQDLEPAYHDAGMFYWMKAHLGLNGNNRHGFEISEMECQDIDNANDWKMAEMKYQLAIKKIIQ